MFLDYFAVYFTGTNFKHNGARRSTWTALHLGNSLIFEFEKSCLASRSGFLNMSKPSERGAVPGSIHFLVTCSLKYRRKGE